MSKIFIGFLFVFLNLSFKLDDTHVINLLPDFIGFMLLYLGTRESCGRKAGAIPPRHRGCWC